jgi:hypothetical protein
MSLLAENTLANAIKDIGRIAVLVENLQRLANGERTERGLSTGDRLTWTGLEGIAAGNGSLGIDVFARGDHHCNHQQGARERSGH